MKKKIFLMLTMVAILVCIFTLSVSAEHALKPQTTNAYGELSFFDESVTVGRTNSKNGFTPYIDAEGTTYARVVVGDGTTFYTFPTAYILSETTIYGSSGHNIYVPDFTSLNSAMATATGTNPGWTKANVYRIELPYTVNRLNGGTQNFSEYSNVVEITLQPNSQVQDANKTMIFWKCRNLETINNLDTFVFRNGCLGGSFQECAKLTNITIGVSPEVTYTGDNVFNGCTALQSINFQEAFPNLQTIGKEVFKNCENLKNFSSNGQEGAYVMQSTLTSIGQDAFNNCKAMKYVSIPASVTSIGTTAFCNCTSLVFVDFNDNQNVFNVDNWGQFYGCTSLLAVSLPDNYKYIPNRMFTGCTSLRAVYLPNNLERIDTNGWSEDPFNNCRYLYFVQDAFEVRDANGNFYTAETFVQPTKPDVYYMPTTLSALCTNKTSGKCFTGSYNLNPTIVFGINMTKTTTADGIFLECGSNGTLGSGITVVFLGDMEQICINTNGNRPKGIKYVFANKNDKSLADVNIINNTTSGYNLNDKTEGFYFCHGNCYYLLNEVKHNGTYSDTVLTKVTGAIHFVEAKKTQITSEATCISNSVETRYCFCNTQISSGEVEGTATGIHVFDDDHDCTTNEKCTSDPACDVETGVLIHNLVHTLVYENGFDQKGVYNHRCDNEGCTMAGAEIVDEETEAIIVAKGYSVPLRSQTLAINAGFDVETSLLKKYEALNPEKTVTIGLAMVNADTAIFAGAVLNGEELATNVKGFAIKVASNSYSAISIEIKGFDNTTEEGSFYKLNLITIAYVKIDDEIHYIQHGGSATTTETIGDVVYNVVTANSVYNAQAS